MPWVDEELCEGCAACVDECPSDAITMNDDDIAVVDMSKCQDEGLCIEACPTEAIQPGTKP
jgi:NAD-dependent dihydropyrimidine dehydrogenase PreA subunit